MKLWAKKSLGQHFLNSKHVLDQIISAGNIQTGENILEIGPGTGILTQELLKKNAIVTAVEKDERAYNLLLEKFSKEIASGQLRLVLGDILDLDIKKIIFEQVSKARNPKFETNSKSEILDKSESLTPTSDLCTLGSCDSPTSNLEAPSSDHSYSLIANIPYYITGSILEKFLEHEPRPQKMVLLVQKEVAERIVARPEQQTGKSKESILSISVKVFGTPKLIAKVPPGAFTPPPSVDSAILSIENISDNSFKDILSKNPDAISLFFKIIKAGFAHKRKILKKNLEAVVGKENPQQIWLDLKLDDKVRAEDLTPIEWVNMLSKTIDSKK